MWEYFFHKKVSAFCRKLELFIRRPNTCKPNISGWKYWFGVLLPHLSGGWQFGASFPRSLWGGPQPPHLYCLTRLSSSRDRGSSSQMAVARDSNAACEAEFGCELISPSAPPARPGPERKYARAVGMRRGLGLKTSPGIGLSRTPILVQHHREQRCLQAPRSTICMAREVFLTGIFQMEP